MQSADNSILTLLGLVVANTTLMFIAHSRHDKLSEHTNLLASQLDDAVQDENSELVANRDKRLDSMYSRYCSTIIAFILFCMQEAILFVSYLYYCGAPIVLWALFLPVLAGLMLLVFCDLIPASSATRLHVNCVRSHVTDFQKRPKVALSAPVTAAAHLER